MIINRSLDQLRAIKQKIFHPTEVQNSLATPKNIFLFLTNLCNLSCEHCFYHFELNKSAEGLSINQLQKLASSFNRPAFVCLTGGEVTLRNDLIEVVQTLADYGKVEHINVCTNGFYVERVENFAIEVAKQGKIKKLGFQISLDGLEATHNEIRKNPRSYKNALETVKLLQKLQSVYPQISVSLLSVVTKHNFEQMIELLHHTQKLGVNHSFSIVRGNYSVFDLESEMASGFDVMEEDTTLGMNLEDWQKMIQTLRSVKEQYGYSSPGELNFRKLNVTLKVLKEQRRIIPCYAGFNDSVIYPDGSVAVCETTKPFANLKDYDFDLSKLWHSEAANQMRQKTQSCSCIHACNLINSLLENPHLGK
ncbi:radical SAM protein [Calothrix membranacea FACHB-236]|nr:radical SAM protein [Calothrix membranacea FACHB-236]